MDLPAKCNETLSTDDPECAIQNNHRGICPSGQHIPSSEELIEYASYECLKNQAGGCGYPSGGFSYVGEVNLLWSSSEFSGGRAYGKGIYYDYKNVRHYDETKSQLLSVRCVKD
jgi:hypothetical protein